MGKFPTDLLCLFLITTLLLAPLSPVFASAASPQDEPRDQSVPDQKIKRSGTAADTETKSKDKKEESKKETTNYPILRIGPGDILAVFVYGENGISGSGGTNGVMNQLPTDYQVDSNGVILFPFVGRVQLEGLTPVEASEKIAGLLNKPRKVTVIIKESNTYWVSILGNVARPGKYQIKGQSTLMSALSEAGGPLPDSDLGGAILLHDNLKTKLDLNKYFHNEGQVQSTYLYPGDVLMVQRSGWPSVGEWAIVASILASLAVVTVDLSSLRKP